MYFQIKEFKRGLDTRQSLLTSEPGTMHTLENMHVNQGGELEKRKAFVPYQLPAQVYGLQETSTGLMVFGSRDMLGWQGSTTVVSGTSGGPDTLVTITVTNLGSSAPMFGDCVLIAGSSVPGLNGVHTNLNSVSSLIVIRLPGLDTGTTVEVTSIVPYVYSPIEYQRLLHPLSNVTMTGVLSSTYYNDKCFVVTSWSNGDVLEFYGEDIVKDFYTGVYCRITPTAHDLAKALTDRISDTSEFTATLTPLPSLTIKITGGTVGAGNYIDFLLYYFERLVKLPDASTGGWLEYLGFFLLSAPVPFNTSNNQTAADLKTAIDLNPYGFTSTVSGNTVTVIPPAVDYDGRSLGQGSQDILIPSVIGDVTYFIPEPNGSFTITSIPTEYSTQPFTVTTTETDVDVTYKITDSGVLPTAPSGAIAQFQITQSTMNPASTARITVTLALPVDGSTITVGSVVYTFKTALTGAANQVKIDTTPVKTLTNLVAAINGTSGVGTIYTFGTVVNPDCSASAVSSTYTTLTATIGGTGGASLDLAQSATAFTLTAWSAGGPDTNTVASVMVGTVDLFQGATVPVRGNTNFLVNDVVAKINSNQGVTNFSAKATLNVISIVALDLGATYNNAELKITVTGAVCVAECSFGVNASTGQNVSVIKGNLDANMLNGGTAITKLSTETVEAYIGRIAASINAKTPGYYSAVAVAETRQLFISARVVTSLADVDSIEATSTASFVGNGGVVGTIKVTYLGVPVVSWVKYVVRGLGTTKSPYAYAYKAVFTAQITGGTPPYTYAWTRVSGTTRTVTVVTSGTVEYPIFTFTTNEGASHPGLQGWQCIASDTNNVTYTFTPNITIS